MINCKTCVRGTLCSGYIEDEDTYRICENYLGTCTTCKHHSDKLFGKDFCNLTCEYCKEINYCGFWEE